MKEEKEMQSNKKHFTDLFCLFSFDLLLLSTPNSLTQTMNYQNSKTNELELKFDTYFLFILFVKQKYFASIKHTDEK